MIRILTGNVKFEELSEYAKINFKNYNIIELPEYKLSPSEQSNFGKIIVSNFYHLQKHTLFITYSDHIFNGLCISILLKYKNRQFINDVYKSVKITHINQNGIYKLKLLKNGRVKKHIPGFFDQIDIDNKILLEF